MYIGMIMLAVVFFGGCFALEEGYSRIQGGSLRASLRLSLMSSGAGLAVLLAVNGFRLEYTPFTLVMAMISAFTGFAYTFCALRALGTINLSLYSVFSMLGGMALPFLQGIIFYGEALTAGKILCVGLIGAALALTVTGDRKRGGWGYYAGVFVLNGMSGVMAKLFTEAPWEKTSPAGYTILSCVCSVVLAMVCLLALRGDKEPMHLRATGFGLASGAVNRVANYLLMLAIVHVDASVQYPLVTGGVMIVSTLICFFGARRPQRRELFSVALGFAGMLALFLIP